MGIVEGIVCLNTQIYAFFTLARTDVLLCDATQLTRVGIELTTTMSEAVWCRRPDISDVCPIMLVAKPLGCFSGELQARMRGSG